MRLYSPSTEEEHRAGLSRTESEFPSTRGPQTYPHHPLPENEGLDQSIDRALQEMECESIREMLV